MGAISLYILLKYYSNENDYLLLIKAILFFALIQSLLGISQSFFGFPIFENITSVVYESGRNYLSFIFPSIGSMVRQGTGTYEHFNGLGAYLAIALPIAYGYYKSDKTTLRLVVLGVLFLGLVTTFSRGALIGSIIGILLCILFNI